MTLQAFALRHRLRTRRAQDGEVVVPGKLGQIYQHSPRRLGVLYIPGRWTPRTWNQARTKALSLGLSCPQQGDSEGVLLFDPSDDPHGLFAINLIKAKRKRRPSEAQLESLAKARNVSKTPAQRAAQRLETTKES